MTHDWILIAEENWTLNATNLCYGRSLTALAFVIMDQMISWDKQWTMAGKTQPLARDTGLVGSQWQCPALICVRALIFSSPGSRNRINHHQSLVCAFIVLGHNDETWDADIMRCRGKEKGCVHIFRANTGISFFYLLHQNKIVQSSAVLSWDLSVKIDKFTSRKTRETREIVSRKVGLGEGSFDLIVNCCQDVCCQCSRTTHLHHKPIELSLHQLLVSEVGVGHTEHHLHRMDPGLSPGLPAQDDVEAGPGVLQEVGDCPLVIRGPVTGVGHQCDVSAIRGICQTREKQFDFPQEALELSEPRPHTVDSPVRIPIIPEQRICFQTRIYWGEMTESRVIAICLRRMRRW